MATKNFEVVLLNRPGADSEPRDENFLYRECPYPQDPPDGSLLIRSCYLSVDPAMRCLMNEVSGVDYITSWPLGETIRGTCGVGVVIASSHPDYERGDLVYNAEFGWPWLLYFNHSLNSEGVLRLRKFDRNIFGHEITLPLHLGVALTALLGLWEKGHVQKGANQTLVVSGASGATGSLAGQMGKLLGCSNVVGICGTDEKCQWIVNKLGFSGAINYKTENIESCLKSLCPSGIDVYFDNVGGSMSDTVIQQMNENSHVILCGQISQYNKDVPYPPPIPEAAQKRLKERNITRDRFLVLNYQDRFDEALKQFTEWAAWGTVLFEETVAEGLDQAGHAFVSMMKGGNRGKQLVRVSAPQL